MHYIYVYKCVNIYTFNKLYTCENCVYNNLFIFLELYIFIYFYIIFNIINLNLKNYDFFFISTLSIQNNLFNKTKFHCDSD